MMFTLRKIKALVLTVVLTIALQCIVPEIAQAASTVTVDTSNQLVNIATIYETKPDAQDKVLSEVLKIEESTLPEASGFLNSSVLKGQDGTQIVALTQWKDLSSYEDYATQKADASISTKPRTFVFEVQNTETRKTVPSIHEHETIMFSEFKMKDPEKQSELAGIVTQMMPGVMQMIPGLQWAVMGTSTDKSTVTLMALWNSRNDFESLGTQPGFDKQTNYWQSYADNEHGLYDVVKIIS